MRLLVLSLFLLPAALMVGCGDDEDSDGTATDVDITLKEWAVQTGQSSAKAGEVNFHIKNEGPEDPHEFVVIRTDLGPLDLPIKDDKVDEDAVDFVDELEELEVGDEGSLTVDLSAGKYLLICNIAEEEDGEIESHYKKGMVATFTVE